MKLSVNRCDSLGEYISLKNNNKLKVPYVCYINNNGTDIVAYKKSDDSDDEIWDKKLMTLDNKVMYLTYNIEDISSTTKLFYNTTLTSLCSSFIIDDIEVTACTSYQFTTTGLHTIKLSFTDDLTTLSKEVFRECSSLHDIIIPETVTSLNTYVFYKCTSLTSVYIPNTVTSIGSYCFLNCDVLKNVRLPESITSIPYLCFYYCKSLEQINIPESVTSIGTESFYHCDSLKLIIIPKNVTSINETAFSYCSELSSIIVDKENTTYNDGESGNCIIITSSNTLLKGCKNTIIPETVTSINSYAFRGCKTMKYMVIPSKVTSLNSLLFLNCYELMTSIKSINIIPENITYINQWAFNSCYGLTSIYIPKKVRTMSSNPFYKCKNITSMTVDIDNTNYHDGTKYNGIPCNCIMTISTNDIVSGCKNTTIPTYSHTIGRYAFGGLDLDGFEIPSNITYIGSYAFYYTNFSSITIPSTVSSIDSYVFEYSTLSEAHIENNKMSSYEFAYCSNLTNVTFNNNLTYISEYVFYNCTSLTSIELPSNITYISNAVFYNCTSLTSIELSSNLTCIYNSVFLNCTSLTSIELSSNLTYIGDSTFAYCSSLPSIELSSNLSYIGSYAFAHCTNLKSITIPSNVTYIGNNAFKYCTGLTSITFNTTNLTEIKSQTFYMYDSGQSEFKVSLNGSICTIPDGVTTIGQEAFWFCGFKEVILPSSITFIETGAFSNAGYYEGRKCQTNIIRFKGTVTLFTNIDHSETNWSWSQGHWHSELSYLYINNKLIETLDIPEGVTTIHHNAFVLFRIKRVIIPSTVTSIGLHAFGGCPLLTTVICKATTPPTMTISGSEYMLDLKDYQYWWDQNTPSTCMIYVPDDVVDTYKAAENWSHYESRILPLSQCPDYCITVSANAEGSLLVDTTTTSSQTVTYSAGDNQLINVDGSDITSVKKSEAQDTENTTLTAISIPNQVAELSNYAFANCTNLTSVTFGSNITKIGQSTFSDCSNLLISTLPDTLTYISRGAFANCNVTIKKLPSNITYIGVWGFENCTGITEISTDNLINWHKICFADGRHGSNPLEFAGGLKYNNAFVTEIDLNTIDPDHTITTIEGSHAGNKKLIKFVCHDGITKIEQGTFYNCTALTDFTFSNNITSIGYAAFENSAVSFESVPESVTTIDREAFANTKIKKFTLPSKLTNIPIEMFMDSTIELLDFGSANASVSLYGFYNCHSLKTIIVRQSTPPTCSTTNTWSGCSSLTAIYVPDDSIDAYKAADGWSDKASLIVGLSTYTG